jgi:hypothetical protein
MSHQKRFQHPYDGFGGMNNLPPHEPGSSLPDSTAPHVGESFDSGEATGRGRRRSQLEYTFEIGRLLNELNWHLHQAVIVGKMAHVDNATRVLEQLETCFVGLFPEERGGDLRRKAKKMRGDWDGYIETEWFAEDWSAADE